jgi:SAM-dependent methyltransferase
MFAAETLNIFEYQCPKCFSSDRDRLYALYFEKLNSEGKLKDVETFIDFAPATSLSNFIKGLGFKNYRTADLYMKHVDDKVDLTNMNVYKDQSIDAFLCSHILEHIPDDRKAISELFRVLSKKGFGIVMVPINLVNESIYEGIPADTEAERWHHYGQFDHVRLYNKSGFVERLAAAGFKVTEYGMSFFSEKEFNKAGIHPRSILYVVSK